MPHTHRLEFDGDVVRKRFVSWSNGEADREWTELSLLDRHLPGLAPEPLGRETDGEAPVVVMSRLPGEPLGGAALTVAQTGALGAVLHRLFTVPVEPSLPERAWGPSVMRTRIREWIAQDYDLGPCRDPRAVQRALTSVRAWVADDAPDVDRILDPVLARGDGNLDNVLWDGGTCRLVDFEEFGVSDIAYEVADVVEHASSRLRQHLEPEAVKTALALTPVQRDRLAAYRVLMAAFWLVMLLPGNGGFRRNPPGSTEDQAAHVLGLLEGEVSA